MQGNERNIQINGFGMASILLSTIALFSVTTIVIPLVAGSLAIIFAILSKGRELQMTRPIQRSFVISIVSIVCAVAIIIGITYMFFYNPEYHDYLNQSFMEIYGMSIEEYLGL